MPNNWAYPPQQSKIATERVTDHGVSFHLLELRWRQSTRLQQHGVWNTDLPDVMQISSAVKRRDVLSRQIERETEGCREGRHPLTVAARVRVPRFYRARQTQDHRLRRIQIVGESLQVDERTDARLQLVGVNRFAEKIVGARVDSSESILAL